MVMIMLQTQVEPLTFSACRATALAQATKGTGHGHMAVATRQKSTARRFVSISAVLEGTYPMLCTEEPAVTTRPADTELIVA
jgi:hypothetical protein